MKTKTTVALSMLLIAGGADSFAEAARQEEKNQEDGFFENDTLTVLARNFYFNRDPRSGPGKAGSDSYSEAWAQSFFARYESGYTQGTFGFGIDAFAMLGLKLDTGAGRNGGQSSFGVLPVNSKGEAADNYSKVGGAIKVRAFDTELKLGDVFPSTPVVAYGDARLLPESFTGLTLENNALDGLSVQGGRLTAMSQPTSSNRRDAFTTTYAGATTAPWLGYLGADYRLNSHLTASIYSSRLKDVWNQHYAGAEYRYPVSDTTAFFSNFRYYRASAEGDKQLGEFTNTLWSGKVGIDYGAHSVSLSHQRSLGKNDFDTLRHADSFVADNSIQYSDFNAPGERSWLAQYTLDMAAFDIPGLSFMTRYGKGVGADYTGANSTYMRRDAQGNPLTGQKRWERNIEARYIVQSGTLKDLSLRLRQATTRATAFEADLDEVRLIAEYPFSLL